MSQISKLMYADPATMTDCELTFAMLAIRRETIERRIEAMPRPPLRLIAALDDMDGDCDLEADCDDDADADLEDENEHGTELDRSEDELDEGNLEPFLGWPEECSHASLAALGVIDMAADDPNDINALPLAGEPLDFRGDGRQAARELIRKAQTKAGYWMRRRALKLQ